MSWELRRNQESTSWEARNINRNCDGFRNECCKEDCNVQTFKGKGSWKWERMVHIRIGCTMESDVTKKEKICDNTQLENTQKTREGEVINNDKFPQSILSFHLI